MNQMNELLIDGVIQHIFSYNNFIDYARLISVNRLFYQLIVEHTNYMSFFNFITESKISFKDKSKLFIRSCEKGHLEIAQWLNSLGYIDTSIYQESSQECCTNGHLEIAEWLNFLIKIRNLSFITSCMYSRLKYSLWLNSFNYS